MPSSSPILLLPHVDLCGSLVHDELFNSRGGSVGSGDSSLVRDFLGYPLGDLGVNLSTPFEEPLQNRMAFVCHGT
uniref:Uncharacterized protein n=1 Tax=Fagus sylvatica TaxID=28930 RepID=A0A2N9J6Z9_FAGSY